MASSLGSRNFLTVPSAAGGGNAAVVRAKRLADLYIKQHTNSAGFVTDPGVYEYVTQNILAPYEDDLTVQQKIAGYENTIKEIRTKDFSQDNTLSVFQQNVQQALYLRGETIRDPGKMALASATALDNITNSIDLAISNANDAGQSTDKLMNYRREVALMAGGQRDLVNALNSGTAVQNLDGYGYFVKTNPIDGSLVGAALLPLNSAPSDIKQGMARIDNSVSVGTSKIPVYLPFTKDADGVFSAKLYNNKWTASSADKTFETENTPDFQNKDNLDISDAAKFPIKKNEVSPGGFGRVVSGVKDGQTQFGYYYRGQDGKVRQLDQAGLDAFKQDPIFANKINGYIPLLAPDEVSALGNIERVNPSDVAQWSGEIKQKNQISEIAANQKEREDYFHSFSGTVNRTVDSAAQKTAGFLANTVDRVSSFFGNRKNKQNKPDEAPQGDKTSYNAPDVVDSGKKIFAGSGTNNIG